MLVPPSSAHGVSAPLFYAALVGAVLGFGLLFDRMAAPAGVTSVEAVEVALSLQEDAMLQARAQTGEFAHE